MAGVDILSYRGDAALGGGNPQGYVPDVSGAFNSFNNTLQKVYDNMARWNVMKFQQGIKDRDALYQEMSQTELPSELLDEDREELATKIHSLKDKLVSNFDYAAKNPKGMIETQNEIKKIKEGISTAKTRWALITQKRLDFRDNPDPTYRDALGKEITNDIKGGAYHMPAPYVRPDYYEKTVFANPSLAAVGSAEVVNKDGFYFKRQSQETPIDDFYKYYFTAKMPGVSLTDQSGNPITGAKTIAAAPAQAISAKGAKAEQASAQQAAVQASQLKPWQIPTAYKFHAADENYMNDEHLEAVNTQLKDIMTKKGIRPDDPRYIDKIAEKGADGNWQLIADPVKWAYGQSVAANYKSQVIDTPDKDLQTMDKTRAQAGQARAAAHLNNVKASLEPAKVQSIIDKNEAQATAAQKKGNLDEAKTLQMVNAAMEPVTATISKVGNILQQTNFKTGAEMKVPASVYAQLGVDQTWSAAPVVKDATIVSMMSQPEMIEDKLSGNKKATGGYVQPAAVIALKSPDGDPNKMKLVALDRDMQVTKIVNPNSAWEEIIKHQSGYKLNDRTIKLLGAGRTAVQQLQGSDKQGLDLGTILKGGVVDTEPNIAPGYDKAKQIQGATYYRYPAAGGGHVWKDAEGNEIKQ